MNRLLLLLLLVLRLLQQRGSRLLLLLACCCCCCRRLSHRGRRGGSGRELGRCERLVACAGTETVDALHAVHRREEKRTRNHWCERLRC